MKKFCYLTVSAIALAVISTSITSCKQSADDALEADIKVSQKMLPQNAGNGMMITGIERDGNYVVYTIDFNETGFTLSELKEMPDAEKMMKDAIVADLLGNNSASAQKMKKLLQEAGVGMKYVIRGKRSGQDFVVTVEPDEVK